MYIVKQDVKLMAYHGLMCDVVNGSGYSSMADVTELSQKLAELQAKLDEMSQMATAGPSTQAQPTIKVSVPRERKLRKYQGMRDDKILEDWVEDAKRAVSAMKLTGADAVDFLYNSLEGAAKDEVRLRPATEWSTSDDVYQILRDTFGEKLTKTQLLQRFFGRHHKDRESIQDFSYALMTTMEQLHKAYPGAVPEGDRVLRDHFVENLRDPQLRRDLRRLTREHPTKTFHDLRDEARRSMEESHLQSRQAAIREVEAECNQASGFSPKIIQDLLAGQKLLADGLEQQQKILAETQAALSTLTTQLQEDLAKRPKGENGKLAVKANPPRQ
ncbi:hypothetical protein QZH41_004523 [Actinostola sp. cb2023]|nr:hypothetical protein QZH41_004523 [Actinostola sp. cb2023]